MAIAGEFALKKNALRISLIAIASVFVFEFIAGIITNSLALLTDSAHALLDAVVTGILLIAVRLASKPRDVEHTYGHGKIETIGSFIGGAALFVVAIVFITEAVERLAFGGPAALVIPGTIGFAAAIYTLGVDVFRITVLGRAARKSSATSIRADLYHAIADFGSTSVALFGLWLATRGVYAGDAAAAILLGVFLAFLSSRFVYQNAMELTDRISPRLVARVRQAAVETEGVLDCRDIRMRKVGREIFVDTTISLKADISFEKAHETSAQVERNIARALNISEVQNITVHFEPVFGPDLPLESIIEKIFSTNVRRSLCLTSNSSSKRRISGISVSVLSFSIPWSIKRRSCLISSIRAGSLKSKYSLSRTMLRKTEISSL